MLKISVLARTALAIMATVVLILALGYIAMGRQELLDATIKLGTGVLITIILVTFLINMSRALLYRR